MSQLICFNQWCLSFSLFFSLSVYLLEKPGHQSHVLHTRITLTKLTIILSIFYSHLHSHSPLSWTSLWDFSNQDPFASPIAFGGDGSSPLPQEHIFCLSGCCCVLQSAPWALLPFDPVEIVEWMKEWTTDWVSRKKQLREQGILILLECCLK